MSQARALHKVQEIELEIISLTKRIRAINAELEDQAELETIREAYEGAETRLDESQKQVAEVELQIQTVVDKRKATEERLYGGQVTNTKELQDMQMEVEALTRRHTQLDELLLQQTMARDTASAEFGEQATLLKETTAQHEARQQDLLAEKSDLKSKADALIVDRRAALQDVQETALKTYNGMRATKSNRPVSVLSDNACTVCGIEQNHTVIVAINREDRLVNCSSCGRILVKL